MSTEVQISPGTFLCVQSDKLPDSSPRMDTISRPPFPQPGGRR